MSGAPQSTADCPTLEPLGGKAGYRILDPPAPQSLALTMFPANVPNYPPFGLAPVMVTFQPEEAACFGKFLGEPPPPARRVPTLPYRWALAGLRAVPV